MPKINVYLSDDLADAVKDAGLPVSAICQHALEQAVRRVTAVREIAGADPNLIANGPAVLQFTARAMAILENARAQAAEDGIPALDSRYLLRSIVSDRDSMAVRVLATLDITPRQVGAELDRRIASAERSASTPAQTPTRIAPDLAQALELAASESSGLGNGYVGTEHLLLGMIGEPDGVAGQVLRSLGAELRITRRAVAAALAGWGARAALAAQQDTAGHDPDQLAAAVRTELAPVLARIERLESIAAG
ncbi:MAG: ATP-dependent Clp protease ATP-binding subunit [Actinobacteria bacterium]|nr:ATP-dependent Clp protease ATP-binding subunit [Actinomycetota bacterium]